MNENNDIQDDLDLLAQIGAPTDAPKGDKPNPFEMPDSAKKALVTLMRQGVVFQAQKPELFATLLRYEGGIRRHLGEVFLGLSLDERQGLAFVTRKENEDLDEVPNEADDETNSDNDISLISKRTLTLHDTLILLVLRKYYQERENAGEQKIIIDIERIESLLTPFVPLVEHGTLSRKKLAVRVKELSKRKLLTAVTGEEDRYEITPITRYVVNAEFLESMLAEYMRLAEEYSDAQPTQSPE